MNRLFVPLVWIPTALVAISACSATTTVPATNNSGAMDDGGTSTADDDSGIPAGGTQCTAARKTHLVPVTKVSNGEVKVISTTDGVATLYVDASAGGTTEASRNPRVYIKLTGERVDVNDEEAFSSPDWDLAFKRVDIFTNGGDAGPGKGGAAMVSKDFDDVTAADADSVTIATEQFFDEECVGRKDEAQFIVTTFSGWYEYAVGGGPTVKTGVSFIVRGADGSSRYKVGIVSYNGTSNGGTDGRTTGRFILKVAAL